MESGAGSIIPRYRTALRRLVRQLDEDFIDETPSPPFRRIVTFDDGMFRCLEMRCSMLADRLIAATDMAAFTAHAKMKPLLADLQTLLAAQGSGGYGSDRCFVAAAHHYRSPLVGRMST